jgi:O-antigen/teichoic acid export membrane protein
MKLATRALALLPSGTLPVGIGLGVLGVASYVHLAVAGHELSKPGDAALSVLWVIVFCLGLGLFFPIEQELIRHVAARAVTGEGIAPVVRRGAVLAGIILLAVLVPLAAAARPLADKLFGGDIGMVAALAGAFLALAVVSVSRGVLAGMGRFHAYGAQLGIDGGLRAVFAGALGISGMRSPVMFGLILTVAPVLSAVLTLGPTVRDLRPGPAITWMQLSRGLGLLIGSSLLAQLVVNVAVINADLLSPGHPAVVAALLDGMVVARVPLFVFASLQAALLPGLAGAIAAGQFRHFWRLLARASAIVAGLGLAGGLLAVIFGPWLIPVLFGARHILGPADFALLATGTTCYMLAMVLGQGAMAVSRHRDQLLAWAAGAVVLAVITFLPGEVKFRVEAAYALSSLTVALALGFVVLLRVPRPGGPDPEPGAGQTAPAASLTGETR